LQRKDDINPLCRSEGFIVGGVDKEELLKLLRKLGVSDKNVEDVDSNLTSVEEASALQTRNRSNRIRELLMTFPYLENNQCKAAKSITKRQSLQGDNYGGLTENDLKKC
jgi:hypothetical protein